MNGTSMLPAVRQYVRYIVIFSNDRNYLDE
jgi:hypothetical protein